MAKKSTAEKNFDHLVWLARKGKSLGYDRLATPKTMAYFADQFADKKSVAMFDDFPAKVRGEAAAAYVHATSAFSQPGAHKATIWLSHLIQDIEDRASPDGGRLRRHLCMKEHKSSYEPPKGNTLSRENLEKVYDHIKAEHHTMSYVNMRDAVGIFVVASVALGEREEFLSRSPLEQPVWGSSKRGLLTLGNPASISYTADPERQQEMEKLILAYDKDMGPSQRNLTTMDRRLGQIQKLVVKDPFADVARKLETARFRLDYVASSEEIKANADVFDRLKAGTDLSERDWSCMSGDLNGTCISRVLDEGHGLKDVCQALSAREDVPASIGNEFAPFQSVLKTINLDKWTSKNDVLDKMCAVGEEYWDKSYFEPFRKMKEDSEAGRSVPSDQLLKETVKIAKSGDRKAIHCAFLADKLAREERIVSSTKSNGISR